MSAALTRALTLVGDLPAARERCEAFFGAPAGGAAARGEEGGRTLLRTPRGALELWSPRGEGEFARAARTALAERGEGLFALVFAATDVAAVAGRLLAAGAHGVGCADAGVQRRFAPRVAGGPWIVVEAAQPAKAAVEDGGDRRGPDAEGSAAGPGGFGPDHEEFAPGSTADAHAAGVIEALDHAVLLAPDYAAARDFHARALGLRLALEREFPARGIRIAFLRGGGVTLEIVGRLGAAADPAAPERFGGLAWHVRDLDAARERLRSAGFETGAARPGAKAGTRVASLRGGLCGSATLLIESAPPRPAESESP